MKTTFLFFVYLFAGAVGAQEIQRINPEGMTQPTSYSHEVRYGNLLFLAGQVSTDTEGNVIGEGDPSAATGSQVIRLFAKAFYHVTGKRPVDPNWESRGRNVQQYELRVQRLDSRFDARLGLLYESYCLMQF